MIVSSYTSSLVDDEHKRDLERTSTYLYNLWKYLLSFTIALIFKLVLLALSVLVISKIIQLNIDGYPCNDGESLIQLEIVLSQIVRYSSFRFDDQYNHQ